MITVMFMVWVMITMTAILMASREMTDLGQENRAKQPLHLSKGGLLQLMTWLSPGFPIGAFSYSHGIEWAVEAGSIQDKASFALWLEGLLSFGGPWSDAVLFAHGYRRAEAADYQALSSLNELALALSPTSERHLESSAQGSAFLKAVAVTGSRPSCAHLIDSSNVCVAYPVAIAAAAADEGVPLDAALSATLHAAIANLISAGVRLIPLGQSQGLATLKDLEPLILETAQRAQSAPLSDLGGFALMSDISSACHETQYTRLFRS